MTGPSGSESAKRDRIRKKPIARVKSPHPLASPGRSARLPYRLLRWAGLAMLCVEPGRLGLAFRHEFAVLRLSVIAITGAMVDL